MGPLSTVAPDPLTTSTPPSRTSTWSALGGEILRTACSVLLTPQSALAGNSLQQARGSAEQNPDVNVDLHIVCYRFHHVEV